MFGHKQLKSCSKIINIGEMWMKKLRRSICLTCIRIARRLNAKGEISRCKLIDMDQEKSVKDCFWRQEDRIWLHVEYLVNYVKTMDNMYENYWIITDSIIFMFIDNFEYEIKIRLMEYHKSAWVRIDLCLKILKYR